MKKMLVALCSLGLLVSCSSMKSRLSGNWILNKNIEGMFGTFMASSISFRDGRMISHTKLGDVAGKYEIRKNVIYLEGENGNETVWHLSNDNKGWYVYTEVMGSQLVYKKEK